MSISHIENWKVGQTGRGVALVGIEAKQTTPPKPYDEAALLADMKAAAKFISDPKLREALKEADGIGTPATRASIIEGIKDRSYVRMEKNHIRSTPEGRAIIQALPPMLTDPGTTALWEEMLSRVAKGEVPMTQFMTHIEGQVGKLITQADQTKIQAGPGGAAGGGHGVKDMETPCPQCGGKIQLGDRFAKCEKGDFTLFREVAKRRLSDAEITKLLAQGRIGPLEGFVSAKNKLFRAKLLLEKDGKVKFEFEERRS